MQLDIQICSLSTSTHYILLNLKFLLHIVWHTLYNMGTGISNARKVLENKEAKEAAMEQLNILEKLVHEKLNNAQKNMLNGSMGDEEIHSGTVVYSYKRVYVKCTSKPSKEIDNCIDDIFSGDFKDGIKDLVMAGINTICGNTSAGEFEDQDMLILWDANSLLRVDIFYYKWNFEAKGVIDESDSVMGCLIMKRVIDLTKTDIQVLAWAITEMATRSNKNPEDVLEDAFKILEDVIDFQVELNQKELQAQLGGGGSVEIKGNEKEKKGKVEPKIS